MISDLPGAAAVGIRNLVLITGDPPAEGKRCRGTGPDSTASESTTNTASASAGPTPDLRTWRSSITTGRSPARRTIMLPRNRPPTHPGEMLLEEFLKPLGMTQTELAQRIRVSFPRINEIVNGKPGITPDTALRLSRLFGTTPEFWLNGQRNWDLWHALRSGTAEDLKTIEPVGA